MVTNTPGFTNSLTPKFTGVTSANATVDLFVVGSSTVVGSATADAAGNFVITNFTGVSGQTYTVDATAMNGIGGPSAPSSSVTFTILTQPPPAPTNFTLLLASDTGIVGDDVTSDRTPFFVGKTNPGATVNLYEVVPTGSTSPIFATVTADSGGNFTVQLPFALINGSISLYVQAVDPAGNLSAPSTILTVSIVSIATDYNADSFSDAALYSRNNVTNQGLWLVQKTTVGPANPAAFWFTSGTAFGPSNVTPFQGDFDGDGFTDLAYYQSSTATWFMDDSKANTISSFTLGTPNVSVPVVGYFNANGPEEAAVFTNGVWTMANGRTVTFGQTGDTPVPGDYTGVGFDELAVYRPSTGQFVVLVPGPNNTTSTKTITIPGIGVGNPDLLSLVPVPGNYNPNPNATPPPPYIEDTEAAVYDPNAGVYAILGPNGVNIVNFDPGDIPAPADYLGNGSTQAVVFRPSTGQFIEAGGTVIATFGQASADIPLAAPYFYRKPSDPPADPPATGTGGTGSTGTGTGTTGTGTGTTGTGTGTTGTGTGTTGTGTGSSSSGQGSSGTTGSTPPAVTSKPPTSPPGTSSHKKQAAKKKVAAHPKKTVHAKPKKVVHHTAAKPKVHVVSHPAKKVIKVSASHSALAKKPTHVVDMALEGVHVNLRRSGKKA